MTTKKIATTDKVLGSDWALRVDFELHVPLGASPGISDSDVGDAVQLRLLLGKQGQETKAVGKNRSYVGSFSRMYPPTAIDESSLYIISMVFVFRR